MEREKPVLQAEQVAQAENREGSTHPVITVLEEQSVNIAALMSDYEALDGGEQQKYIKEHFGFLADAIVNIEPFSLDTIDMLKVWSYVMEKYEHAYHLRVSLAALITTAYIAHHVQDPVWRQFPRWWIEREGRAPLPQEYAKDTDTLEYGLCVLKHVVHYRDDIFGFIYRNDPPGYRDMLFARMLSLDKDAREEIERRETPLLSEFYENFGAAAYSLRVKLQSVLPTNSH